MSHLGRRLSALVDSELGDAERDQVHAHLVSCDECRAEAASLRTLKRRVRGLAETPADGDLTSRLIALAGLPEPAPPRSRPHGAIRARAALGAFSAGQTAASRGHGHTRYVVAGAVAALAVGLGAASFAAGGPEHLPAPTITPQVDVYMMQHAATAGLPSAGRPRTSPVRP